MHTVIARSNRGAAKMWLAKNRTAPGVTISVKEREVGDWVHYKVS